MADNKRKLEEPDSDDEVKPTKAYRNQDFIASREARTIRVVCEFEESLQRLRANHVKETIVFFGSSKAKSPTQHAKAVKKATEELQAATTDETKAEAQQTLDNLELTKWMCGEYDKVQELSKKLTLWSLTHQAASTVGGGHLSTKPTNGEEAPTQSLVVCTGGGRGMMEAANRGASQVPHAKSIGMGISLPSSNKGVKHGSLNAFVSPELAFEYHYFFTRKYWLLYPCRALIVAAGGFGTLDALFELLTLKQTGKIKIDVPVVMFGAKYWKELIDFEALVNFGTISQRDHDSLFFTDDVDEAYNYVTSRILELRDLDRELFYSAAK